MRWSRRRGPDAGAPRLSADVRRLREEQANDVGTHTTRGRHSPVGHTGPGIGPARRDASG
jgi:hypothetical protein